MVRFADSVALAGNTAVALAQYKTALRAAPRSAELWYGFGLLNWQLATGGKTATSDVANSSRNRDYLRAADSALHLATQFSPDSARYWIALGQFSMRSTTALVRAAATRQMENALIAASKANDSLLIATSADELGTVTWRRYEQTANRALATDGHHVQLSTTTRWRRDQGADYIATFAKRIEPPTGETDYLRAFEYFRTAVAANPTSTRNSRHLYMALTERQRWAELLKLATTRANQYAFDAQARFAIGLAQHRLGQRVLAQAAFDEALSMVGDEESARLMRLTRILRPKPSERTRGGIGDSVTFTALSPGQKLAIDTIYWLLNDPLVTTAENEYQLEFLSRVVQAELQWSDETVNIRGADTDRGDIFVRFGPPDLVLTVAGTSSVQQYTNNAGVMEMGTNENGGATLVWSYTGGQTYFFDLAAIFGTARTPLVDQQFVSDVKDATPVSWSNLGLVSRIDTMDVRVTRFRARGDSADIVVAANIPLDSLVRDADIVNPNVTVDYRVYDGYARTIGKQTATSALNPDTVTRAATRSWTQRIGRGLNMVRVEAMQPDIGRAVKATLSASPDTATGFGLSDILLTNNTNTEPPASATSWRTLGLDPSNGVYRAGDKIGLVWEIYGLAAQQEANRYRVAITVTRTSRSPASSFAMQVLDRVGTLIKQSDMKSNQVSITFDRTMRSADTQLEYLSLDGVGDSRGEFRLQIAITDLVAKTTSVRETSFRIH